MHSLICPEPGVWPQSREGDRPNIGLSAHFAIAPISVELLADFLPMIAEISIYPAHAISMPAHDDPANQHRSKVRRIGIVPPQQNKNAAGFFGGYRCLSRHLLRAFAGNSDGGAAPMLALAALPLFGFVGAAVDYSRAASARTAMQAALDATALMLSKEAPRR